MGVVITFGQSHLIQEFFNNSDGFLCKYKLDGFGLISKLSKIFNDVCFSLKILTRKKVLYICFLYFIWLHSTFVIFETFWSVVPIQSSIKSTFWTIKYRNIFTFPINEYPKWSTNTIVVMGSLMGVLYYCYEPHYGNGSSTYSGAVYSKETVERSHGETLYVLKPK